MKTIKFILVTVAVLSLSLFSFAQKPFAGTITYGIEYIGEDITDADKAQAPSELILTISGNKCRMDQNSSMYNMAQIFDEDNNQYIMLMDAMGQKMAPNGEIPEEIKTAKEENNTTIKLLDETKVVAGYKCKKAEMEIDGDIYEIYYTDEIQMPDILKNVLFSQVVDGLPLQFSQVQEGVTAVFTAKEVKKGKPKAHLFKIPDDFTKMTFEEMGGMFGM